jgi:hypothetical protein
MRLKVSAGGVPPGSYTARFMGVEPVNSDQYGEGLRWKFAITQGPQRDQVAARITGLTPSPRNGCGKILAGLVNRPLALDEEVDIDQFIGRVYLIVVVVSENGGSRIDALIASPTQE